MANNCTLKFSARGRLQGLLAFVLLLMGCSGPRSDYAKVDLISVGGTVTMDGSPLPDVTVVFEGDGGQFSFGKTDAAGRYELRFDSVKKGVTPGAKLVRITSRPVGEEEGGGEEGAESGVPAGAREAIPRSYNVASTLRVNVSPKQRQHDFDLTSR
jgi:hypothetical protein